MTEQMRAQLLELDSLKRLELAEFLWDSLDDAALPPLTREQIVELERRWAAHQADGASAHAWDDVKASLIPSR